MAKGYQGLLKYRHDRALSTESISKRLGDCFHNGHTVLPIVHQWHESISKPFGPLRNCDRITPGVLKVVKDDMLQVPDYRLDAKQLWGRVKQLIDLSPVGTTSTYNTLPPSGGSMTIGPLAGSRVPPDSPPNQWRPEFPRTLPQTPTKHINQWSGHIEQYTNGGPPLVSKIPVAEPDTFFTYAGETHGGLNYVSSDTRRNHASGQYNQPMSQPEASVDRPEAQHFISDEQPHGRVLHSPFDKDPSREVRTNTTSFRGRGSALDKRNSQVPNQASTSMSRTYPIRPGPSASGNLDEDLYGASDNENEYRQSHQRGPSDVSLSSNTQHYQPERSSPHEGQPDKPNLNSSPTSIPSSPPLAQRSPPIPSSSAVPAPATAAVSKDPISDKGKVSIPSKRQVAANKLKHLPLITALEWRRVKKENGKWINRLKKREEPKLPGEYLLGRVGKRDHVCRMRQLHFYNVEWAK